MLQVGNMKQTIVFSIVMILVAIIVVSSLILYETGFLGNQSPNVSSSAPWQHPIENFATGLAADSGKVFTIDISGNIACYNAGSGRSIWNGSVGSYFSKGVTVSDGKVYGGAGGALVGCLDETTGKTQWETMCAVASDLYFKRAPDNIIAKNNYVVAITDSVTAFNISNGDVLWQAIPYEIPTSLGNITNLNNWWVAGFPLSGDPFDGNTIYALGGNWSNQYIFKLNTDTGTILWQSNITTVNDRPNASGTYQDQVIFADENQVFSLNSTSGDSLWNYTVGASIYEPTFSQNLLLFGASDGTFNAVNLANGALEWKTKVDNQNLFGLVNSNNFVTVFPVQVDLQNQRIYYGFDVTEQLGTSSMNKHDRLTGNLCALDLTTGKIIWIQQIDDTGEFYGTPVGLTVNNNTVYLTENLALWIYDATSGNLINTQQVDHYILPPVNSNNEVFIAADLFLNAYS